MAAFTCCPWPLLSSCCCYGMATNPYCCDSPPPGYLSQPHHIPGYRGHCPTMRDRNGGTFGRLSRDILEDPCAVAGPCPLLLPPGCGCNVPRKNHAEDRFEIKGSFSERCPTTDIYRMCEPMMESYTGHVPAFFPCNYGPSYGRAVFATKIFLHNAGMYNKKYGFRG